MKLSRLALAIAVMPGLSLAAEPYLAEPLVVTFRAPGRTASAGYRGDHGVRAGRHRTSAGQ